MKRLGVLVVTGMCLVVWSATAQENPRRTLAEQLLNAMNMDGVMEKSFEVVKKQMPAFMEQAVKAQGEKIPPEILELQKELMEKVMKLVSDELSWEKLKTDFIPLYADTFTEEELKGLLDFYRSPVGQSFSRKQPELMQKSMEISQKMMMKIMPEIQKLVEELERKAKDAGAAPAAPQPANPQ